MKSSLPLSWEHFNSRHDEIEINVSDKAGSYKGIRPEALYTSNEDLEKIFSHELVQGTFVDLGCGHGKTALFYGGLFPERRSLGIEFEAERLKTGLSFKEKHQLTNVELIHADLARCEIPLADTYFLYFPTGPVLDRILSVLYEKDNFFRLIVIESHGDLFPRLDLENWIKIISEIPLLSSRHHPSARIYERQFLTRNISPAFTLSFEHHYLVIEDDTGCWIGNSFGMEWSSGDRFELLTPPRTLFWKNVKKMMVLHEFKPEIQQALMLRSKGEVTLTTSNSRYEGHIRKIFVEPTFGLELSSGEKVEWDEILTIIQGSLLCYESSSDF